MFEAKIQSLRPLRRWISLTDTLKVSHLLEAAKVLELSLCWLRVIEGLAHAMQTLLQRNKAKIASEVPLQTT